MSPASAEVTTSYKVDNNWMTVGGERSKQLVIIACPRDAPDVTQRAWEAAGVHRGHFGPPSFGCRNSVLFCT